jgi:predicted porin
LKENNTAGVHDGKSQAYQTAASVTIGSISAGALFQYFDQGGEHNDIWIVGAGLAYAVDDWTLGMQYSRGRYNGDFLGDGLGTEGGQNLHRIVATASYNLAPGVDLDADIGYTWYHDTRDFVPHQLDTYQAAEIGIGSSFSF